MIEIEKSFKGLKDKLVKKWWRLWPFWEERHSTTFCSTLLHNLLLSSCFTIIILSGLTTLLHGDPLFLLHAILILLHFFPTIFFFFCVFPLLNSLWRVNRQILPLLFLRRRSPTLVRSTLKLVKGNKFSVEFALRPMVIPRSYVFQFLLGFDCFRTVGGVVFVWVCSAFSFREMIVEPNFFCLLYNQWLSAAF